MACLAAGGTVSVRRLHQWVAQWGAALPLLARAARTALAAVAPISPVAALTALAALLAGCAAVPAVVPADPPPTPQALPAGWHLQQVPGATRPVPVLRRAIPVGLAQGQRRPPWRVIVLPGSGCTGFAPIAQRYFAGLRGAEIWVLHKPGADVHAGAAPPQCSAEFVAQDALGAWQREARAALQSLAAQTPAVPTWLVGISEGGELLPGLADAVAQLQGLVLLSAPGLDPAEAGTLQAERQGRLSQWQALQRAAASARPESQLQQGRSLRYWRDLFGWRVQQPLADGPWPLLQVWGGADALVPPAAYERFAASLATRQAPWCSLRIPGGDHGLQTADADGVQRAWARLMQWQRSGALPCARQGDYS